MDLHRLGEARSLELHRRIAERLRQDPSLVERARARVRRWRDDASVSVPYVDGWARVLELPLDGLCAVLVDEGEHARALRQVTPFAGVIDPRTRWRIWREVRERATGGS